MLGNKNLFYITRAYYYLLNLEQGLSQEWPVSAEVDLDDMEYHEGREAWKPYCIFSLPYSFQALVVRRLGNTIHRINRYPVNKC